MRINPERVAWWLLMAAGGFAAWRLWKAAEEGVYQPPRFYRVEGDGELLPAGDSDSSLPLLGWVADVSEKITSALWTLPEAAAPYAATIEQTEDQYGIPRNLLARLLYQESHFRPDIINGNTRSAAGALGIAQFMPSTALELGIDPLNPWEAIPGAGRYLTALYASFGNWREALAAYNWGQGNVARKGMEKAPDETQNYVSAILTDLGLA